MAGSPLVMPDRGGGVQRDRTPYHQYLIQRAARRRPHRIVRVLRVVVDAVLLEAN